MWQQEGLAMGLSATLRVLLWTLDSISHLTRISIDIYKHASVSTLNVMYKGGNIDDKIKRFLMDTERRTILLFTQNLVF